MTPHRAREAEIGEILARVEAATGPDRELDGLIARDVDGLSFGFCGEDGWSCGDCEDSACGRPLGLQDERHSYPRDWRDDERLPLYTASIDAACEAVQRALKVYSLRLTIDPSGNGAALTWWPNGLTGGRRIQAEGVSASPVLAILAALLRALSTGAHQ